MSLSRPTWDQYFIGIAWVVRRRSTDPSTKHGCVFVTKDTNIIVATGYNELLAGLTHDDVDVHTRPEKYKWFRHSEENAEANCSHPIKFIPGGVKAYITGRPCLHCLQEMVSHGIQDFFLLERRGYISELPHQDQKDFDLIVQKKGLRIVWLPMDSVNWLKEDED